MKLQKILFAAGLFVIVWSTSAQIPQKPTPERLVNDFAGILSSSEKAELEHFLVMANDSTSNQICVVIVNNLGGMDKAQFATELGQEWKIGDKEKDNGIVVLLKPKTADEQGEFFIATGYGLEGGITDAFARRITEKIAIPYFKQDDYYGGLKATVVALYKAAKGEYNEAKPGNNFKSGHIWIIVIVIFVLIIIFSSSSRNKKDDDDSHTTFGSGGILPWILFGGGGSSGSFGGNSSGSFGGFGGGSFGGGGAGGSW